MIRGRALLFALVVSRAAAAQPADDKVRLEQARASYNQGVEFSQKGEYAEAIQAFEEAYKWRPTTGVVLHLANAYENQFAKDHDRDKLARAVKLYHEYLDLPAADLRATAFSALALLEPQLRKLDEEAAKAAVPPPPPPPPPATTLIISASVPNGRVAFDGGTPQQSPAPFATTPGHHDVIVSAPGYKSAERGVDAVEAQTVSVEVPLEELPATVILHGDAGAAVFIDGKPAGEIGDRLTLSSGRHRLTAVLRGHYAWEHEVTFDRGGQLQLDAPLTVTTQRRATKYVLAGAGLLLVSGVVTTLVAYSAQSDAKAFDTRVAKGDPTITDADRVAYNDAIDRRDNWRTTSYALFGGSLAAVATAALLYYFDTPRVESAIVPVAGPTSLGVAWRF